MDRIGTDGMRFADAHGRTRIFSGVNLVSKGRRAETGWDFSESWGEREFALMEDMGLNIVRLGFTWSSLEPAPGEYDAARFDWIEGMLDLCRSHGIYAMLDLHQDLFGQRFSDGAPDWATLTNAPYVPDALWSEAYLARGAVTEALDAFWANAPVEGVGLRDRYARLWRETARRVGGHPAVIAADIMNEPHPGGAAEAVVYQLLDGYARAETEAGRTMDISDAARMFANPQTRMELIDTLRDTRIYRAMTERVNALDAFESGALSDLYDDVGAVVRAERPDIILMRENSYFGNIGVRCAARRPQGSFAFAPHGYDWVVDTPAVADASDERAGFIFERHRETQRRLGAPVLVGEWGGMACYDGMRHERFLLDMFERNLWSQTYWCWFDGFERTYSARSLRRAYPQAVAGELEMYRNYEDGRFECRWHEGECGAASEFRLPDAPRRARLDGERIYAESGVLSIPARGGSRSLLLEF